MSVNIHERKQEVWDKKFYGKKEALDVFGITVELEKYGKEEDGGWTIDHIWPIRKKGSNALENLQVLSYKANLKKASKLEGTFLNKEFKVVELKKVNGLRIGKIEVVRKKEKK